MIKLLKDINLSELLFVDIETRSGVKELDKDTQLYHTLSEKITDKPEWDTPEEFYASKAGLYAEFGRVCCVSVGILNGNKLRIKSFTQEDEKELLLEFKLFMSNKLANYTPCTYSDFPIQFLIKRMWYNGFADIPDNLESIGEKPWLKKEVNVQDILKAGSWASSPMLDVLTAFEMDTDDLISGADVSKMFWKGKLPEIEKSSRTKVLHLCNILLRLMGKSDVEEEHSMEALPLFKRIRAQGEISKEDWKELQEFCGDDKDKKEIVKGILKGALNTGKRTDDKVLEKAIDKKLK